MQLSLLLLKLEQRARDSFVRARTRRPTLEDGPRMSTSCSAGQCLQRRHVFCNGTLLLRGSAPSPRVYGHTAYGTDESTVEPVADRPARRTTVMYSQRVYSTNSRDLLVLEQQTWSIQPIIRARECGPTVPGQT